MSDLRYPIGAFAAKDDYSSEEIAYAINRIEALPDRMESAIRKLSPAQLDTPYREGGWTVRQVVHHVSDSHMNAYIRTKWTLTESTPTIKAYFEKDWAETAEVKLNPAVSISLLHALHFKWVSLLRLLTPAEFKKGFIHPESGKLITLERQVNLYSWHGEHHLAHITELVKRMGWN
jgi:DinB superfamily